MSKHLQHDRLIEMLSYDPEIGVFFRKQSVRGVKKGAQAGHVMRKGYRQLMLDGVFYLEHRLAWFYVYKKWPDFQIDHINEVKTDNRILNLRDVCQTKNLLNQSKPQKNNTSGFRGVSFQRKTGKYRAQLMIEGKQHHLGEFETSVQAYQAYLSAKAA